MIQTPIRKLLFCVNISQRGCQFFKILEAFVVVVLELFLPHHMA